MKNTEMLKKNYQFKKILGKGKFYREKELEVVIIKNNFSKNYLGIAIGTKNGKAFQRNKAKRIIRECYYKLEPKLIDGNSIIILIKKEFDLKQINYHSILEGMEKCFKKAKIIKEEEENT